MPREELSTYTSLPPLKTGKPKSDRQQEKPPTGMVTQTDYNRRQFSQLFKPKEK